MAEEDSEQFRKLFIGGLHINTTDESLKAFYEQWGTVVDCIVMRDNNTKRSRCFGFVTYSEAHMVDSCMSSRPHIIDTKQVDPKRAMPREDSNKQDTHKAATKIFVGGIRDNIDENVLQDYFGQFGAVKSAEIVKDKETGKKRGIAFVTFEDYDIVDKVVLMKMHNINGVSCEAKKAVERDVKGGPGGGGPPSGGRGGRGGRGGAERGGGRGRGGGFADRSAGGYGGGAYGGQGQYSEGYGAGAQQGYGGGPNGGMGGGFGSGYGAGYGGGAMKNTGYSQRAAGPYGGGYGSQQPAYGTQAAYGNQAAYGTQGGYGNGTGAYGGGAYGAGYGGPGYGQR